MSLTVSVATFAQSTMKDDIDIIQSVYGKSKTEVVKGIMNLSDVQISVFSKIYDEYEAERKALGRKKIQLINDYATNYATLTDVNADQIVKEGLKNNLDYDKLYSKYYGKLKKGIGALNAAKFIQVEVYLQTEIRNSIQNSIPFIGEIELAKPTPN